jgi:DNA-binding transcriptional LysR family regulator
MVDRFLALQLFIRVARTGSFSVAGRDMGLSQPSASRIVAALEKDVGVALFTRTTRGVTLTEAGSDYLIRAEAILAELEEANHAARGTGELRGLLRVAVSTSFAVRTVLPHLSPSRNGIPSCASNSRSTMRSRISWATRSTSRFASARWGIRRRSPGKSA